MIHVVRKKVQKRHDECAHEKSSVEADDCSAAVKKQEDEWGCPLPKKTEAQKEKEKEHAEEKAFKKHVAKRRRHRREAQRHHEAQHHHHSSPPPLPAVHHPYSHPHHGHHQDDEDCDDGSDDDHHGAGHHGSAAAQQPIFDSNGDQIVRAAGSEIHLHVTQILTPEPNRKALKHIETKLNKLYSGAMRKVDNILDDIEQHKAAKKTVLKKDCKINAKMEKCVGQRK